MKLSFFVCTVLLYMSIYSTNILSVGLSVRLQKAKELLYLWMFSSMFINKLNLLNIVPRTDRTLNIENYTYNKL